MAIMSKEYYADIESVYKKPEDYELAGKGNAYIRIDAEAKVTGTAVYTDDVYLPGMYYCKLVHSPYAHALIKSIDFSEALKVPGVKGVLTGADFPEGHNLGNPEAFKELADKEPLCRKKVRMVGDEVAAVCATTEEIATYAASLVKVEYEPLEPVLDPFYSMQPDAPAIHYPGTSNLSIFTTMKAGDPDKAFAEAYYTDKHYYRTQEMVHAAIEPHGAVAKYENGEWTVWTTTQGAYVSRYWIAWGLGVPESQVRVIKPMLGGGFGGKLDVFAHELCPCLFSKMTGHPVKCILKRDEVFMCTRTRHPISFEIESAFTKEGKLLAKRCKHILDGGAYGGSGIAASGMDYIALGHIHKESGLRKCGSTYYAWPGCPEGRGFDETGEKHVYIVTLGNGCSVKPVCIAQRKYEILNVELKSGDVVSDVLAALPENTRSDVYRIILRGEAAEPPQPDAIISAVGERFFSLQVRDETSLKRDVWESAGEDNLRGRFLMRLKTAFDEAKTDAEREKITQAARWGLAALDNREEVVRHDD